MGQSNVVFLLDIDNTLLDNDRITGDLPLRMQRGRRLAVSGCQYLA
jgi:hypothetical protein